MPKRKPNPLDQAVGERIRFLRKSRNMTQPELANALGVTFQQVQKYENGKNRVTASRLQMVANALTVPVSELFDGAARTSSPVTSARSLAFDPQTLRLAEAFAKISDKKIRSSLIDLAEALAMKRSARS